jgi:hypothetical protein
MNWEALAVIGSLAALLGIALYIPARWWAKRQLDRSDNEKAGAAQSTWTCEKCGGEKRLSFVRAPRLIASSVVLVALLFFVVRYVITDQAMKIVAIYLGGVLALAPALSTLRIRCLGCESQSK